MNLLCYILLVGGALAQDDLSTTKTKFNQEPCTLTDKLMEYKWNECQTFTSCYDANRIDEYDGFLNENCPNKYESCATAQVITV